MTKTLDVVQKEFLELKDTRTELHKLFVALDNKRTILKKCYLDLVKSCGSTHVVDQTTQIQPPCPTQNTHESNSIFTMGLDSFHFQNKLIEMEYDNLVNLFRAIDNRIYCEYYKLYHMIQHYVIRDIDIFDKIKQPMRKTYPVYKDLEPLKVYDFSVIMDLQQNIVHVLNDINEYIESKNKELTTVSTQSEQGLNIHTIVTMHHYTNAMIQENVNVFMGYLEAFNTQHGRYITSLSRKLSLFLAITNEEITLKNMDFE